MQKKYLLILLFFLSPTLVAKEYIIYSISQNLPMTNSEPIHKNYYVNIGSNQGVYKNTSLDVYRMVFRIDPYKSKYRHSYRVKVGQLKVIHSENNSAIAVLSKMYDSSKKLVLESRGLMIGDPVAVKINR